MRQAAHDAAVQGRRYVDMREAPRSSLMFRTAKLLCESGEYVCVVRDISATGAKLRLFHAPPPDTHMFLEVANGDRYAMERVWLRDDHIGVRFSCTIEVDHFIAEPSPYPRRSIRLKLQRPADIVADGIASPAVLLDVSQQGARIEAGRKFAHEQMVRIAIDGQTSRLGCIRWRSGYTHGIVLQQSFKLDELAHFALALQPFAAIGVDPDPCAASLAQRYG